MRINKQFFHRATNFIAKSDINRIHQLKGHKKSEKSVCSSIVEGLDMLEEDTFREWTVRNENRINSQRLM